MQNKYRVAILGMGGVGGFIGGKLAAAYSGNADVEIIFIARGDNAQSIKENGLKLITQAEEITVHPHRVADANENIGAIDLLVCCTKTYGLEESIQSLSASITADTLILPLLNGVDNSERVQTIVPHAKVLQGCIYIVSKLAAPGVVQQRGEFYALHFGGDAAWENEMNNMLALFQQANINTTLESNIAEKIWAKFSFISPIATYTSAHNISIGKILESEEHTANLKKLTTEIISLANALHIHLPADIVEKNFGVMSKLPYEATSSMQADFANHNRTELETLTGYVVRQSEKLHIDTPAYSQLYTLLKEKQPTAAL